MKCPASARFAAQKIFSGGAPGLSSCRMAVGALALKNSGSQRTRVGTLRITGCVIAISLAVSDPAEERSPQRARLLALEALKLHVDLEQIAAPQGDGLA